MEDDKESLMPLPPELEELINKINTPAKGMEDAPNPDGTRHTYQQQIESTKQQIRVAYSDLAQLGTDKSELVEMLKDIILSNYTKEQP